MRTYVHVFSLGMQTSLEYRSDLYLSLFSAVFPTILQLYIWKAVYTSPDMVYQGYTYPQIVLYSLMSALVSKLTMCGFEYRIGEDIKSGGLNKFIVRPVNYVLYCFFEFEGAKLLPLLLFSGISAVLIGIASRLFTFMLSGSDIALCALAVIGALLLNFLIYFCIAALAFWMTEIVRLFSTFSIISVVLSGGVLPLDVLLQGGVLDTPELARADLDGGQVAAADQGSYRLGGELELLGDVADGQEPDTHA